MPLTDPLSFQLYSSRNFPPLETQFEVLRQAGYTNVEPYGAFYGDVGEAKGLLARFGLASKSGHFGLQQLDKQPEEVVRIAKALDMSTVVVPYLGPEERPSDREGWRAIGSMMSEAARRLEGAGLRLAWHNHDFEFKALPDGSFPIEHLLAEGVLWEADIAWVVRGGADPKPWIARYTGRIPLVHVKDIAPPGENRNEDGWADVGTGIVPWAELWPLCVAAGAEAMIAEHDNPSDFRRFAQTSARAMKALNEGGK
jgi:sugar phosphate isomerase/epimerase